VKIHPDGTVDGSPAECAEYMRLRDSASTPVDMHKIQYVPQPWRIDDTGVRPGDVTWRWDPLITSSRTTCANDRFTYLIQ
jgi:hypothetical protein